MDDADQQASSTSALNVGANSNVGSIVVEGSVVGRDQITITENRAYDVSDVAANPYLGLASYSYETRECYGGRDQQLRESVDLLTTPGAEILLTFITGASGSGKSSFAQAGLVPALESSYVSRGRTVRWSVMRPGRHPLSALGECLARLGVPRPEGGDWMPLLRTPESFNQLIASQLPDSQVSLLVLDQFEEVFTQSETTEREALCAVLGSLDPFQRLRMHILATLRADYLPALFGAPPLFAIAKRDGIELRAMSPTELSQAIRKPLEQVNRQLKFPRSWEPALVQRLIQDVGSDPALLPLLQVTLTSLWNDPPRRLTLDRYSNLTAALESTAERVYTTDQQGKARSEAERQTIMSIFLDLVEVSLDDDARRDVRRTVPKADLLRDHAERAPLIDELIAARLLSATVEHGDDATIDIIHETLLTNWARLRDAIADQRQALQSRARFRLALHEWLEHDQSDDYLIDGVRLAEARDLASRRDTAIGDANARAFLERSAAVEQEAQQRELNQARALAAEQHARAEDSLRAARRLRVWLIAAATAAVLAIAGAVAAVTLLVMVDRQAKMASSRALAAQSSAQLSTDPELGIVLARQAEQAWTTQEAADSLRLALATSPVRHVLHGPGSAMGPVAIAPDGRTFAAADADGGIRVWQTDSGQLVTEFQAHSGPLLALAYNNDGSRLLSVSRADPGARLWDARSGGQIAELTGLPGSHALAAVFSHDGRWIAAATDGSVALWDAASLRLLAPLPVKGPPISLLAFSADDSRLLTASVSGAVPQLWTVGASPSSVDLGGTAVRVSVAAFDLSGQRVLIVGTSGDASVWDVATGKPSTTLSAPVSAVSAAAFSPDSTHFVTGGADGVVRVWDASQGHVIDEFHGHTGPVTAVAYATYGSHILSASFDGTARVWNATDPTDSLVLRGHSRELTGAQFSPDGQTVVTSSLDGTVGVWSVGRTQAWTTLRGHSRKVYSVAFSGDGRYLASGGIDSTLHVWTLPSTSAHAIQLGRAVTSVAFGPDGHRLAFGLNDGTAGTSFVSLEQPNSPALVDLLSLGGRATGMGIHTVAFSPDGARIVTAGADHTARIVNATTADELGQLTGHTDEVTSAAFDAAGRRIATSSADGTVRTWDATSFAPLLNVHVPGGWVYRVEFSPDGRYLATGSDDSIIRIWQADNGQLMKELANAAGPVYGLAFSRDGQLLASVSREHHAVMWETAAWQRMTELPGETGDLLNVAFSLDGRQVATAGDDGLIHVYPRELFAPVDELMNLVPSRVTRQLDSATAVSR